MATQVNPTNSKSAQGTKLAPIRLAAKTAWNELLKDRLSTFTALIVIAVALLVPMILITANTNIQTILNSYTDEPQLTAYLTSDANLADVSERLLSLNSISFVSIISKQAGLEELGQLPGLDIVIESLDVNPLPDTLLITPLLTTIDDLDALALQLERDPSIDLVEFDSQWLSRLRSISASIVQAGYLVGILCLIAFILVIGNSVRFLIHSDKDQIRILQLLGASDSYILGPLLFKGAYYGLGGGLMAALLQSGFFILINNNIQGFSTQSVGIGPETMRFSINSGVSGLIIVISALFALAVAAFFGTRELRRLIP